MRSGVRCALAAALLLAAPTARAQQGKIIDQQLAGGEGYTVIKLWGSHYQIGYAQGFMLADEIVAGVDEIRSYLGGLAAVVRAGLEASIWKPAAIEEELDGMLAGVKAALPAAELDKLDLKMANTYGDWAYPLACRSHSAWGSFVDGATKTLSTRRLDFSVPTSIKSVLHHVLAARDPADGSVRWVNLAWPGYVVSVTGVNEYGTLASLHDYQSKVTIGPHMPRVVAVRHALTLVAGLAPDKHLDAVYQELQKTPIMTGTFINYYVPQGQGGVLTCLTGQACSKKRVPQSDYYNGEVLITTNDETDGHSTPGGGDFMGAYYAAGGKKKIADHYGLMGHTGMHLLSVDFRARGDMTIWAEGGLGSGVTPTIKIEFADVFAGTPASDGGGASDGSASTPDAVASGDGSPSTPDSGAGADQDAAGPGEGDDGGCGCRYGGEGSPLLLLLGSLGLAVARRRRTGGRI